jgi:hypothetical protein
MADMPSDEDVARQIVRIFQEHHVVTGGTLRRNHFLQVRDADFQRGLDKAVANQWVTRRQRDRYTYELTSAGHLLDLSAVNVDR